RNGFYKRIVTNLDTKNKVVVILYLPRLKCCNHDCRYKLEHQLKSAVTFKIRPTFIQKYSRHLVCDLIALLCYREPSLDEHDQFKELVTSIEQKQGQDIYLLSYMQKSNPFLRLYYHRKPNFFKSLLTKWYMGIKWIYSRTSAVKIDEFYKKFLSIDLDVKQLINAVCKHWASYGAEAATYFVNSIVVPPFNINRVP
ncbi:MAG TPA: hypothetical protein DCQ86_07515, partial [Succinivibrio sp.]|nr:hypothetical protein [Succinivibrio sp.]